MSLGTRDYASPRAPSFRPGRTSLLHRLVLAKDCPACASTTGCCWPAVVALSLIGTLLVYSATQPSADPRGYLIKQLINVALGLMFMVAVSLLDYRQIRMFAPIVYVAACLGLVAVLSPLGTTVNGARSWITLPGGNQIEPSEFAKTGADPHGRADLQRTAGQQARPAAARRRAGPGLRRGPGRHGGAASPTSA